MGAARFEGVDILDSLGQIMELHTQHYKDDFDMDKELIQNLVLSGEPEERPDPGLCPLCQRCQGRKSDWNYLSAGLWDACGTGEIADLPHWESRCCF